MKRAGHVGRLAPLSKKLLCETRQTRGNGMTTTAIIIVNAGLDVALLCGLAYHMGHARHLRPHTQDHKTPEALALWQGATAAPDQRIAVITQSVGESTPTESHTSAKQP